MPVPGRPNTLILMGHDEFEAQFDAARLSRLQQIACVPEPIWTDNLDDPALTHRVNSVEVLLTGWGAQQLNADRLQRMPQLHAMIHTAGTIRPLVTPAFWDRGTRAANVADANAVAVAEFTFAAIVMAFKSAPFLSARLRQHPTEWGETGVFGTLGNRGRTVGVVGFSHVGRRVVSALQRLEGTSVFVYDPYVDSALVEEHGGRHVDWDTLLTGVDLLTLHVPSLPETQKMVGARDLAKLRDHVTVINTARGSVIDTAALERECVTGRLNAILDVTDPEPLPSSSQLYRLPNVMITPHIAGSLGTELYRMTDVALDELERYAAGTPMLNEISSEDLRLSA